MNIPHANNLGYVAVLRHVQHIHEPAESRNPDDFVGRLFPVMERLRHRILTRKKLDELRAQPFYYYLLARTRHYDDVYRKAISDGLRYIVNIGCGSDTRAHRFKAGLQHSGTSVLECDLPEAIATKQRLTGRFGPAPHVQYVALDLNAGAWPTFEESLEHIGATPSLVMMEGVSPYIDEASFNRFLALLAGRLTRGSVVAYDYKLAGFAPNLAGTGGAAATFRLPASPDEVRQIHERLGFRVERLEPGWDLQDRLTPGLADSGIATFRQDMLVTLAVG